MKIYLVFEHESEAWEFSDENLLEVFATEKKAKDLVEEKSRKYQEALKVYNSLPYREYYIDEREVK
jgi:hypothetical protein